MISKIVALVFFFVLLTSCGTKVIEIDETKSNSETNIQIVETEESDPIIEDFKNELDTLLESSEEDT